MSILKMSDGREFEICDIDKDGVIMGRIVNQKKKTESGLEKFRIKCRITQTQLARYSGISQTTISRYESIENGNDNIGINRQANDAVLSALSDAGRCIDQFGCKEILGVLYKQGIKEAIYEISSRLRSPQRSLE